MTFCKGLARRGAYICRFLFIFPENENGTTLVVAMVRHGETGFAVRPVNETFTPSRDQDFRVLCVILVVSRV